jgi:DNA (cytosine-5)-methyltransferase 1
MLRDLRPRIALFENVPGLFVSNGGRFFNGILGDISEVGYAAEWQVISASETGAPHERKRAWIVAYTESERLQKNKIQKTNIRKSSHEKPEEWKQLHSITCGKYKIQHWQSYEHILTGSDDGLSKGLDRIKCLGNAIVPQVPALEIFTLPAFDYWRTA